MSEKQIIDHVARQIIETKEILSSKTKDSQGRRYPTRTIFVKIKKYIEDHVARKNPNSARWIVVPGLRGVGKSTLLAQLALPLLDNKEIAVAYFSLDEVVNAFGSDLKEVIDIYEKTKGINLATTQKTVFLFLDEVHYDPKWASFIKVLHDKNPNIFIFATGSSAVALQKRNPDEQRRLIIERLYPMSFAEFMVLQHNITPPAGIKNSLKNILYHSQKATDVYARLKELEPVVNDYWKKVPEQGLRHYLRLGSIPFANNYADSNKAYEAIYQTVKSIVEIDLTNIGKFKKETIPAILQMLLILSSSCAISLRKLSAILGINTLTVKEILDAFVQAELLIRIYPHGSVATRINKVSKYFFMSPAIRAAVLNLRGGDVIIEKYRGYLFEDIVAMYLYKEFIAHSIAPVVHFDASSEMCADFMIEMHNHKIPVEVGLGQKDTKQMWEAMEKLNSPYGLIISSNELDLIQDTVVKIPHKFFLLT